MLPCPITQLLLNAIEQLERGNYRRAEFYCNAAINAIQWQRENPDNPSKMRYLFGKYAFNLNYGEVQNEQLSC